jgi:nitrous oxidase accessory protein NosD
MGIQGRGRTATHLLGAALLVGLWASTGVTGPESLTCGAGKTLGERLLKLKPGETLLVSGTCKEHVVIPEALHDVTLDGQGSTTIDAQDAAAAAVTIRGRGITLRGITVIHGAHGVVVQHGGAATLDGLTIHDTGGNGILVVASSSAQIVNSEIRDNPGSGVAVAEGSSARIGYLTPDLAGPNVIRANTFVGIFVSQASTANIAGNTIASNGAGPPAVPGIWVQKLSHARVAGNTIDASGENAILVQENSGVTLPEVLDGSLFGTVNMTTAGQENENGGEALKCRLGGYIKGYIGTLAGTGGPTSFEATCIDDTLP